MSRTQASLESDLPSPDGIIFVSGLDCVATTGATTATRVAAGNFSLRGAAAASYVIAIPVTGILVRTGVQDDVQEFFGSTRAGGAQNLAVGYPQTLSTGSIVAGTNVTINVLSSVGYTAGQYVVLDTVASGVQEFTQITSVPGGTSIVVARVVNSHTTPFPIAANLFTTPAGATGRPPFAGLSQLTPQTTIRAKGIRIKGVTVIYQVTTTAITVPTFGLFATQYTNGVAPTVTTLITQATNGLATATNAQPYAIPIPVPVANQNFVITPNTEVIGEFDFTNSTGTVDVFGFAFNCDFNYD